jgi:hypothetical protein
MRHKKAAKTIEKLISLLKTKSLFRDPNPDPDSQVKISRQDSQVKISRDRHRTQIRIQIRRPKSVVTGIEPKSGSRFAGAKSVVGVRRPKSVVETIISRYNKSFP